MPPQVLPVAADVQEMRKVLVLRYFYTAQGLEHFRASTKNQRAIPPHPREGRELAFIYDEASEANDGSHNLAVVVWTTYLFALGRARENDCGWVVIEEAGVGRYFIPVHRTKNFTKHLILEAQIARCRVRTRPTCPVCAARMEIENGKGIGARYWRCPSKHSRETWDHPAFMDALTPEAKQHLRRRRGQRAAWYKKRRKAGKRIRQAVFLRHGWVKVAFTGANP
jgi:hypothetical protein